MYFCTDGEMGGEDGGNAKTDMGDHQANILTLGQTSDSHCSFTGSYTVWQGIVTRSDKPKIRAFHQLIRFLYIKRYTECALAEGCLS